MRTEKLIRLVQELSQEIQQSRHPVYGESWLNAKDQHLLNEAVRKSKHLADAVALATPTKPPTGDHHASTNC